jgi:hypothetical protein
MSRTERIRALNDALRVHGRGGAVYLTAGIHALPDAVQRDILNGVQAFDAFGIDNDPYDEHDFGIVTIGEIRAFFKIDYYDRSRTRHSTDPSDPALTHRVLTIMLASEY